MKDTLKNNKKRIIAAAIVLALVIIGLVVTSTEGVFDKYEEEVASSQLTPAQLTAQIALDGPMLANVLHEVDVLEESMIAMNVKFQVAKNANAGVYTVEQERHIARAYAQYLALRKALFHIAFRHKDFARIDDPATQNQSFLLAYTAGLTLYRNAVAMVLLFRDQPNARRKLNEADPILGVPAGVFDEMFANITNKDNVQLVLDGVQEYKSRRASLESSSLLQTPGLEKLLERLDQNEAQLEKAYTRLSEGKKDVLWTAVSTNIATPAYKTQAFVSMLISHLRVPIHAKGLTNKTIQETLRPQLKPGDILLTRRDGYLSNTFLPGNWGHAALYLGSPDELRALGAHPELEKALEKMQREQPNYPGNDNDGLPFAVIEAIGEGVRLSSLEFATSVNLVAVLRPNLDNAQIQTAAARALMLRGTPYDFSFDVGSQDKIICTELVYRAYAPHLDVPFEEVMGRKTLKPDGMLRGLAPTGENPKTELVLFGRAVDGKLQKSSVDDLMATVL